MITCFFMKIKSEVNGIDPYRQYYLCFFTITMIICSQHHNRLWRADRIFWTIISPSRLCVRNIITFRYVHVHEKRVSPFDHCASQRHAPSSSNDHTHSRLRGYIPRACERSNRNALHSPWKRAARPIHILRVCARAGAVTSLRIRWIKRRRKTGYYVIIAALCSRWLPRVKTRHVPTYYYTYVCVFIDHCPKTRQYNAIWTRGGQSFV